MALKSRALLLWEPALVIFAGGKLPQNQGAGRAWEQDWGSTHHLFLLQLHFGDPTAGDWQRHNQGIVGPYVQVGPVVCRISAVLGQRRKC